MSSKARNVVAGATQTAAFLVGGLVLGIVVGNLLFEGLEGHTMEPVRVAVAAIPAIAAIVLGSALWGIAMGRLAGRESKRRMALAGVLGFVPVTIGLSVLLLLVEPIALERWGDWLPVHRLFTVLFVPTAFLITTTMAISLFRMMPESRNGWRAALFAGALGASAFFVINMAIEAAGWVVGGPGAAERFTMLTVTFVGDIGAALAAGGAMGLMLGRRRPGVAV